MRPSPWRLAKAVIRLLEGISSRGVSPRVHINDSGHNHHQDEQQESVSARTSHDTRPLVRNSVIRMSTQIARLRPSLIAIGVLGTVMLGFWAGRISAGPPSLQNIELNTHEETFQFKKLYGSPPSPSSNAAWAALFPLQGGFFKHPELARERSAFSVFHQLHCLDGIRQGYWVVHNAAVEGKQIKAEDMPFMSSPPHIQHCIDLIRQALMCQADTTVEVKDKEIGGVTGFGTTHVCHNWDDLIDWVTTWEGFQQEERKTTGHAEHLHRTSRIQEDNPRI